MYMHAACTCTLHMYSHACKINGFNYLTIFSRHGAYDDIYNVKDNGAKINACGYRQARSKVNYGT